jgi:hypothetical protein
MLFSGSETTQVLTSQKRPFVIAQGKLLSHQGNSCLDVRHLSVLGLPLGIICIARPQEAQTSQALGQIPQGESGLKSSAHKSVPISKSTGLLLR